MALARRSWIRILGLVLGVPILFIGLAIASLMIISAWSVVGDGPRAKARVTRATLQELADANRAYITVHGTPAPSLKDLGGNGITALMLYDGWKQPLVYTPATAGTTFELFSVGPDGAAGTADDLSIE